MSDKWYYATNGWTVAELESVFMVVNDSVNPPIKHELMHLIATTKWGYPHPSTTWANEGLATYASNNCGYHNVAELYRYFLDNDMLIKMDDLSNDFYSYPEMIAYHQAGYIVQYLIEHYGISKFKMLWQKGMNAFEAIYGIDYITVENAIKSTIKQVYETTPNINWDVLKTGCGN